MHERLTAIIGAEPWMMSVLQTVRDEQLPDAWVGAGLLRDLVWDTRFGIGFDPNRVRDVDVAFFDPSDLSRARDQDATARLGRRLPGVPWEATNQAAVHTWYSAHFGGPPVPPLTSIRDAVATWPETATSVAARLDDHGTIEICDPLGLSDLLTGIWQRNPRRISIRQSQQRLHRHDPATRWPGVHVIAPT